jgi:hypothetical protein
MLLVATAPPPVPTCVEGCVSGEHHDPHCIAPPGEAVGLTRHPVDGHQLGLSLITAL